jgi:hypothetical protein
MNTHSLKDLALINTPLVFRDKAPLEIPEGNARIFSIKDIGSGWPIDFRHLPRVQVPESKLNSAVSAGDVLMPGRGLAYPARYFVGSDLPIFPSGQVHVIRVTSKSVDPRYLCWYLNRDNVQNDLRQMLTGATIQALNKSQLQGLRIEVPHLTTQIQIAELQSLLARRTEIRQRLEALEKEEFDAACQIAIRKETRDE